MIDILVPVLGRPQSVEPLLASIEEASHLSNHVIFLCSPGDEEQIATCIASGEETHVVHWTPERSDYPRKMNYGYSRGTNPWMLLAADDLTFHSGWDTEAMIVAQASGAQVIGTNDLAHPDVKRGTTSTHPLVRREYVKRRGATADCKGVLIHPGYDHNYSERELVCVAHQRKVWAFARTSRIGHRHPAWGSAPEDETYRKGKIHMGEDLQLFLSRSALWAYAGMTATEKTVARRFQRRARRYSVSA